MYNQCLIESKIVSSKEPPAPKNLEAHLKIVPLTTPSPKIYVAILKIWWHKKNSYGSYSRRNFTLTNQSHVPIFWCTVPFGQLS